MDRVLSGIKPTGKLTLGNYIGALKNFPTFQDSHEVFLFIADLHALTLPIDPNQLKENSRDICALYLASGLDPKKTTIFLQSMVSEHAELATILGNYAYMGEMARMTQFKEKSAHLNDKSIGLGLFTYPVLMAADILLYDTKKVPVGEDQRQHVELTRDLVLRFNHTYGEVLTLPEAVLPTVGARIMSLTDPHKKMSKSDPKGDIFLLDDPTAARKKIMSAVTDMDCSIHFDKEQKPGISNLMTIYAALKECSIETIETEFKGANYGTFKKAVADVVVNFLEDLQTKYRAILATNQVDTVLEEGAKKAKQVAGLTLNRVKQAVGIYATK